MSTNIRVQHSLKQGFRVDDVQICNAHARKQMVCYEITCTNPEYVWKISKTFKDIENLHCELKLIYDSMKCHSSPMIFPLLPSTAPSRLTNTRDNNVIKKSSKLVETYLSTLIKDFPWITDSNVFSNFICAQNDSVIWERHLDSSAKMKLSLPEVTEVNIVSSRVYSTSVVYHIVVRNSHKEENYQEWSVSRRYRDFLVIDAHLRRRYSNASVVSVLPPRRVAFLINHLRPEFREFRRIKLNEYLKEVVSDRMLLNDEKLQDFLGC